METTPLSSPDRRSLDLKIRQAKLRLLKMHYEAKVGHIGGNLSCLDSLMTLFHTWTDPQVILSKGHAAGALYVSLWSCGKISEDELKTFHRNDTWLSGHPAPRFRTEIPFATGSLGHGLSLATGLALGKKLQNQTTPTYCVTSDGEWQEGSTWEALIFAQHHQLHHLKILIDENGVQGFGSTSEVASMGELDRKIRGFGATVIEVDGHCPQDLLQALQTPSREGPLVIIMKTTKGKGVSFMENQMEWHYLPMTEAQYHQAIQEVESS
ncbi:MAG: transketolase [Bdellovibrionales bacterium]|nr:transketolase [Bdellovibrionales bacterium]